SVDSHRTEKDCPAIPQPGELLPQLNTNWSVAWLQIIGGERFGLLKYLPCHTSAVACTGTRFAALKKKLTSASPPCSKYSTRSGSVPFKKSVAVYVFGCCGTHALIANVSPTQTRIPSSAVAEKVSLPAAKV